MRLCSIDGCERSRHSQDWCRVHYRRWKNHGDPLWVDPHTAPHSNEECPRRGVPFFCGCPCLTEAQWAAFQARKRREMEGRLATLEDERRGAA